MGPSSRHVQRENIMPDAEPPSQPGGGAPPAPNPLDDPQSPASKTIVLGSGGAAGGGGAGKSEAEQEAADELAEELTLAAAVLGASGAFLGQGSAMAGGPLSPLGWAAGAWAMTLMALGGVAAFGALVAKLADPPVRDYKHLTVVKPRAPILDVTHPAALRAEEVAALLEAVCMATNRMSGARSVNDVAWERTHAAHRRVLWAAVGATLLDLSADLRALVAEVHVPDGPGGRELQRALELVNVSAGRLAKVGGRLLSLHTGPVSGALRS